jgi:hypothetical protein
VFSLSTSLRHSFSALWRTAFGVLLPALSLLAGGGGKGSSSPSTSVHINEYTRQDGTVVGAYDRAAPGTAQPSVPAGSSVPAPASSATPGQTSDPTKPAAPLTTTGPRSSSSLELPSWLSPVTGAKELQRSATAKDVTVSYFVRSTAAVVANGYQRQLQNAAVAFESVFNGIGTVIRASATNGCSCVVRITEDDLNSEVFVLCTRTELGIAPLPVGK